MFHSQADEFFSNRFEPDGDGFLFRATLKAPGYKVSRAERDGFVADYHRRTQIGTWGGTVVFVLLIIAAFFALPSIFHVPADADYISVPVIGLFVPLFLVWHYWIWNAPVRALRSRAPTVEARSKEEARRLRFQRLTWARLGGALVVFALVFIRFTYGHNLLIGWYRLWLVLGSAFLILIAVQVYRKWKSDRAG
jgi:hypothetical protein